MDTTLWQSSAWADYQRALGREVKVYKNDGASALVIIDKTVGGFSTWDLPRGPLWTSEADLNALLTQIVNDAKKNRCMALYVSPTTPLPSTTLSFVRSRRHIQPQATRILDLTKSDEEILAQMHPKGRYNIGVAKKHGITVRAGNESDIETFYNILAGTGGRDGFKISQKSHYTRFLGNLRDSFLLIAELQGRPIAELLGVCWNGMGIYYYGASSYKDRQLMAPYLLQWEAIQHCKKNGCTSYDLFGVSPEPAPTNDPWIGISDFKRKFGGTLVPYPPEQMLVLRPIAKTVLDIKRRILG